MKKSLTILSLLALLCLTSCKKEIKPSAITGIWNVENEETTEGPRFLRLSFQEHYDYYYIDPIVSDTIYTYKNVKVQGDSLLLTDRRGHITLCTIDQLNDSVLTLSSIDGVKKKVTYRKTMVHIPKDYSGHPEITFYAKDYNKDSLDIIMRTNSFWSEDYEECQEIHGCTREEMLQAKALLLAYIKKIKKTKQEYPKRQGNIYIENPNQRILRMLPFDHYFRQYWASEYKGDKIIHVDLASDFRADPGEGYTAIKRQSIGGVRDGGPGYGEGSINLTKKQVIYLGINGP